MQQLNFPHYGFRFKNRENACHIFDPVRKKFVALQPEDWVRQNVVQYLLRDRQYPLSHINVEKQLKVNRLSRRYDVVVFNPDGSIAVLVECKSPSQCISQETFDQIARYNLALKANYLMVTNGLDHYFCRMDFEKSGYDFLPELPPYLAR
jgi:hypothetical protein